MVQRFRTFVSHERGWTQIQTTCKSPSEVHKAESVIQSSGLRRLTEMRFYQPVILSYFLFLGITTTFYIVPSRPVLALMNGVNLFFAVCEGTRWDRLLLERLLKHFEFWYLSLSNLLHLTAGMLSHVGHTEHVKSTGARLWTRQYLGYPTAWLCFQLLFMLDIMPLVPRRLKVSFCSITLIVAANIFISGHISTEEHIETRVCALWCTTTESLRMSSLLPMMLFNLKFFGKALFRPGECLIISSRVNCSVNLFRFRPQSAEPTLDRPSLLTDATAASPNGKSAVEALRTATWSSPNSASAASALRLQTEGLPMPMGSSGASPGDDNDNV